jgi:hypothetical protein
VRRIVERCRGDVNVDIAVLSKDELRAASGAELALRLCRGEVNSGAPATYTKVEAGTPTQAITGAPAERWHIRQWH